MKLTWYGHSTFRVEIKDSVILIDPFFDGNPAFDGDKAEAAKGCTHIVLTHGHGDHLGNTVEFATANADITVIANFDLCMWLNHQNVTNTDPTNTGGSVYHDDFSVTYVIAHHSSARMEEPDGTSHDLGDANGVILKSEGEATLYHMGDTEIFGDMGLINELHRPKIGLVPIGDRFTMNGESAALACKRFFDFDTIIPMHYGSFDIIEQTPDKFVRAMHEQDSKVRIPTKNETFEL